MYGVMETSIRIITNDMEIKTIRNINEIDKINWK
jgi:hypothetical protein